MQLRNNEIEEIHGASWWEGAENFAALLGTPPSQHLGVLISLEALRTPHFMVFVEVLLAMGD